MRSVQGVDVAEEMMGNVVAFVERRLGRGDVESFVDLHGVGVDDLAVEPLGQMDGELGFAHRCGTENDHERRRRVAKVRHLQKRNINTMNELRFLGCVLASEQ